MSEAPDFGSRREFYTFAPETLGQQLPQFEIRREVGKGSMGIVYEARVRATGERIALKILPPSLSLTERALARFLREGQIMARVRHPDIVGFVDQGVAGRLHWFAMEFVDGTTLEERLKVGPLPVQKACAIAAAVGRALQFAHDRGVVHRDLKPGNLMLRDGDDRDGTARVAITDFGLARETGTGSMTESGAIVGTPMYMAPELVLGGSGAANTLGDVYGLGATLYALVTGQPPFDGPTAQSVLKALLEQSPRPPHRLRADLPPAVSAILGKAMERDPARRYGSTLEFAEDLERFLRGERVLARRPGALQLAARWIGRHRLTAVLLLLVTALSVGAVVLVRERNRSALERSLAEAERSLAIAGTSRDDQDRPRSAEDRRDLLLAAIAGASQTIARDEGYAMAWLVRARAHLQLEHWEDAIYDLDTVERLRGAASPELLHLRITALRQQGAATATRRLQQDLTALLQIDPSPHTRALVADYLLDLAAQAGDRERAEALTAVHEVLAAADDEDPRAMVARARLLESEGEVEPALAAMRAATARHAGNLYVHLQAAAMFDRHDLRDEGAQEHERARHLGAGRAGDRPRRARQLPRRRRPAAARAGCAATRRRGPPEVTAPPRLAITGPAGCGKTTVGRLLAARLGVPFADADDFHSDANRARMAAGVPLDDAARAPWLATLHVALTAAAPTGLVLACSALRRAYRATLADGLPLRFVQLTVPLATLRERLADRRGHFFAPSLLDDQVRLCEPLASTEGLTLDGTLPAALLVERIAAWLAANAR